MVGRVRRSRPSDTTNPKPEWRNGRRAGFKILCPQGRAGSSPASGTMVQIAANCGNLMQKAPFSRGFSRFLGEAPFRAIERKVVQTDTVLYL
jgi:hypothetical protein